MNAQDTYARIEDTTVSDFIARVAHKLSVQLRHITAEEDIRQELYLAVFTNANKYYTHDENFESFAKCSVRRCAAELASFRRNRALRAVAYDPSLLESPIPTDFDRSNEDTHKINSTVERSIQTRWSRELEEVETKVALDSIREILSDEPEGVASVFSMLREGKTQREIAEATGRSQASVSRIQKRIRNIVIGRNR